MTIATATDTITQTTLERRSRINKLLRAAVEAHPNNEAACIAAVTAALLETDAATVWEFFAPDQQIRLHSEIGRIKRLMREELGLHQPTKPRLVTTRQAPSEPAERAGAEAASRTAPHSHGGAAVSAPHAPEAGSGQSISAQPGHNPLAAPGPGLRTPPWVPPSIREINRRSLLRTFMINGRPIGDCTAKEAREWGRTQRRNGKFAELLAFGLSDEMIVGHYKTDEDAAQAQQRAIEYAQQ